jgi:hypothetical protein
VHEKRDFINPKKNEDYTYKLLGIKPIDGNDVYIISFEIKNKKEKGELLIDNESLAFVGIDVYNFSHKFDTTPLTEKMAADYHLEGTNVKPMFMLKNKNYVSGVRFLVEKRRKKSIYLGVKYNHNYFESQTLNLKENEGRRSKRDDFSEPLEPPNGSFKKAARPFTFQLGYFF